MMKKTSKSSQIPKQGSLIEPPLVIDLGKLLAQTGLSENEQGIVKRRLLENRSPFEKVLQKKDMSNYQAMIRDIREN